MTAIRGDMGQENVKVGFLYPPGGGEYEYYQVAEALDYQFRPYIACAERHGGDKSHDPDALRRTAGIDALAFTASTLAPLKPQAVMWACTSGSFILGRGHAEAQVRAISAAAGCPAGSTSLAFVHALEALGTIRVSVVATYPPDAADAFVNFLAEHAIDVCALECLNVTSGNFSFALAPETVREAANRVNTQAADALLIPDTAMAGFSVSTVLEPQLEKPVLTANQVTLWDGLRLAGSRLRLDGFGSLLAR